PWLAHPTVRHRRWPARAVADPEQAGCPAWRRACANRPQPMAPQTARPPCRSDDRSRGSCARAVDLLVQWIVRSAQTPSRPSLLAVVDPVVVAVQEFDLLVEVAAQLGAVVALEALELLDPAAQAGLLGLQVGQDVGALVLGLADHTVVLRLALGDQLVVQLLALVDQLVVLGLTGRDELVVLLLTLADQGVLPLVGLAHDTVAILLALADETLLGLL